MDRIRRRPPVLDDQAFGILYEGYLEAVFNYCLFQTSEWAAAEDLTAEAFARVWAARGQYLPERGDFAAWLFTIARRVVVDWQRQRARRPLLPLDPNTPDGARSPEEQAQAAAMQEILWRLVGTLGQAEQELIALKFGAGMTNRQIAHITKRSESAIGTALHKIMRKLRAEWEVTDA